MNSVNASFTRERCPNLESCSMPGHPMVKGDPAKLTRYQQEFCLTQRAFSLCKRYQVFLELGFCPGFVLPDTDSDLLAIIDEHDNMMK